MENTEFLTHFLPQNMLEYFDVVKVEQGIEEEKDSTKKLCINIHLEEKPFLFIDKELKEYESKGFSEPKKIKDFPIRGKACYLYIKRRRWRNKNDKKEVKNDISFLAENSKVTEEFSAFLKIQIETKEEDISTIAKHNQINPEYLREHYKKKASNFNQWEQKKHCEEFILFPENVGESLSIDETSLSKGELYTILTNKEKRAKTGSLIACIKGTKSDNIIKVLNKIPIEKREKVKEVSMDMANNMELAITETFPKAKIVTDRFHVIKLGVEALQQKRILLKKEETTKEAKNIKKAKKKKQKYIPFKYLNGDTPKQLLTRSMYLLTQNEQDWTKNQKERSEILFKNYRSLEQEYKHLTSLKQVYSPENTKITASSLLNRWCKDTFSNKHEGFYSVAHTIESHFENILNFFNNRSTNANAESFNAKIKLFRANLRGVTDVKFFLFRLAKLFGEDTRVKSVLSP